MVPGIYFYDSTVSERAKKLSKSERGELEITDLNKTYLIDGNLQVMKFPRGTTWLDMGTPNSLLEAAQYIKAIQDRQGLLIGSPEEAAWQNNWITSEDLFQLARNIGDNSYSSMLMNLVG